MQVEDTQWDQFLVRCFAQEIDWCDSHKQHYCQKQGITPYRSHHKSSLTWLPCREPRGSKSFAVSYTATISFFLIHSIVALQRNWDREDKEQSSQQHFGISLIMKEAGVSGARNTHQGNCSNYRGVGKCGFYCIVRAVIKEISAKKICSIQKLSGLSCHSFLSDLIVRQVFHNRLNDS